MNESIGGGQIALVALFGGKRIGRVLRNAVGKLRFVYDPAWRTSAQAFPLSLSMPLAAEEHHDDVVSAFLWGLLPDSERTLDRYARVFGVSARNPVALLSHIGLDCAGAIQFIAPDRADETSASQTGSIDWLDDSEIARELRSVREIGIAGTSQATVGQFSLAGAQPKIALLEESGRWGRPTGRIPTNRILKPPTGSFHGFVENEHFCLELAARLGLGSVASRIMRFGDEIAIVVDRFDREKIGDTYVRIHQEDACQALGIMPTRKYESEGGPGIADLMTLIRDASSAVEEDIERFVRATALNWIIAATDAHAKNYAFLHGAGGRIRLAPFYDIISFLPYADAELHRVKSAMKIGHTYLIRRINRSSWDTMAKETRLSEHYLLELVASVIDETPAACHTAAAAAIAEGLDETTITALRDRVLDRVRRCRMTLASTSDAGD